MEKNKREIIFNERGELCDKLVEYFINSNSSYWIPKKYSTIEYHMDWQIIGKSFEKYFTDSRYVDFTGPIKPNDLTFEIWQEAQKSVRELLYWLSNNLFYPSRIVNSRHKTDMVLLRIAVSKLDKIKLPKYYIDAMFSNIIECYYSRKRVYTQFYYQQILGIPF